MKVCVLGLWHLGTVTAACLASGGHHVTGLDFDETVITNLKKGQPPLFEPGLEDLVKKGIQSGTLDFSTDPAQAVSEAKVIWVAYDTPVDDDDNADVNYVIERVGKLFPHLKSGQEVLISSQLPVGTSAHLEKLFAKARPNLQVSFSYSPENLRLGKAISVFTQPDRVVIGTRSENSRKIFSELLSPFTDHIEWMSVESAEMTKHALNAFLATSVTFINEIASICEQVGADAKEVERGLKIRVAHWTESLSGTWRSFCRRDIGPRYCLFRLSLVGRTTYPFILSLPCAPATMLIKIGHADA